MAEGLGRGLQSLAQRFESARRLLVCLDATSLRSGEARPPLGARAAGVASLGAPCPLHCDPSLRSPATRQTPEGALLRIAAVLVVIALAVAGCGTDSYESSTHDAQRLVPELADLPPGFSLDPAESFPFPTSKILAEPFSASSSAIIRRERLYGYQAAFTSPRGRAIECTAAVYRSSAGASNVFRLRTQSIAAFLAESGGHSLSVGKIGEETYASHMELPASLDGIAWRFRNVLSTCVGPLAEIRVVARAQQGRIARALG